MIRTPMDGKIVREKINEMNLQSVGLASIRELNRIVNNKIKSDISTLNLDSPFDSSGIILYIIS